MTHTELAPPARVLAIGAHPDDIEFGCGATLAKWAHGGARVDLAILTDGSKGTWDPSGDPTELAAQRRDEQRDAAGMLGAADVHFFDAVDGELDSGTPMRARVCELIRDARPDIVLGHDPWKQYRLHPDHRHAGQLVIDGIVAARDPHFFPGRGSPHRPTTLLLFEAQVVDHIESVDNDAIGHKVAALLCHRSQWRSTMGIDATGADTDRQRRAFEDRVRNEIAVSGGEVFKLVAEL